MTPFVSIKDTPEQFDGEDMANGGYVPSSYLDLGPIIRVAVLQRVIPGYRVGLFNIFTQIPNLSVRIFVGSDIPNSKVRSTQDVGDLDVVRLPTRFFNVGGRLLVDHRGLNKSLAEFSPNVILCEGESNILSYLKAAWYRRFHPDTALVHWSLGAVPGAGPVSSLRRGAKRLLLSLFDAFIVYSSHGKEELLKLGCPADRVHVAVNVSDIERHLAEAQRLSLTQEEARRELGLPEQFTVIYAGALDADKRLENLLVALTPNDTGPSTLVILGEGGLQSNLPVEAQRLGVRDAYFPGKVPWEVLAKYYRAGDVFVLPGRGGMVISEAMAHGLPVIVHQADGTESDLVRDGETGLRLANGSPEAIRTAIEKLRRSPAAARQMGLAGQELVANTYNQISMAEVIRTALIQATDRRQSKRPCISS